jgi:hypothetical protein
MITEVRVGHEGDFVILKGPEGEKMAKISGEDAIKMAHDLFDSAEKALRGTNSLNKYE